MNTIKEKFTELNKNWKFKLANLNGVDKKNLNFDHESFFDAEVPGTVHTDLINNGFIEDPFYSDNENKYQWISDCDWEYKTLFDKPADFLNEEGYFISFKGLDTIADVYLNGKKILSADNMFRSFTVDISDIIKKVDNELRVLFYSPVKFAKDEEVKYGKLAVALNSSRVHIRKAQYSYGWDWGPTFPTSGIWKDVILHNKYFEQVNNLSFNTNKIDKNTAEVEVGFEITEPEGFDKIKIKLSENEKIISKELVNTVDEKYNCILSVDEPKLWNPNGIGEVNLYDLSIELYNNNELIASNSKRVGIRTIELQLNDGERNTFRFNVNGKPIFAKGFNWIPSDLFLTRTDKSKYDKLLSMAKDANVNIIRVWGGGFYENDEFYNLCDEKGLLVWQDFMFACAEYPEDEKFIDNITEEFKQNINRIKIHPSLALWCGNNENEWIWQMEKGTNFEKMSGCKIYHDLLPAVIKELNPETDYWYSSPFGFDDDANSFKSGNTHQWQIWSGWKDYEEVVDDKSLFVSEFGFQGPANFDTWNKALDETDKQIQSEIFEHHNKQVEGPERLTKFLWGHLPVSTNWDDYIYLTQLNQGLALKTCIEHWRTNDRTNGSIIWQLNDCWPVTSWAVVDSESSFKLAGHFVKNSFRNELLSFVKEKNVKLVLHNSTDQELNSIVKISSYDNITGTLVEERVIDIQTSTNQTSVICENLFLEFEELDNRIIVASFYAEDEKLVSRNIYSAKRWKHIKTSEPSINIEQEEDKLILSTNKLALFVDLYQEEIEFADRGFVLLPDEKYIVPFSSLGNKKLDINSLQIFTLNKYLNKN